MTGVQPLRSAYRALVARGRLTTDIGQAALIDRLAKLQDTLVANPHSHAEDGIYIHGGVGTGKSRLVDLFASTLPAPIRKTRIHFHEFMMDVHMRLHRARQVPTYAGDPLLSLGRDIYAESNVLCFDEFQVSDIADAMMLKRLFTGFWNAGGVMVSTSNRHPTELYANGLNRSLFIPFIEELMRRCEIWKMEGRKDYRMEGTGKQKAQEMQMAFFNEKKAFLESLYEAVAGVELKEVEVLTVTRRKIRVQAAAPSTSKPKADGSNEQAVVHATFAQLCEGNMSSIDFHALCKFASSLYISDLRQFAADELDFLRRFITLIDIAYEYKTRVVIHSKVPLASVFEKVGVRSDLFADRNLSVRKEGGSSSSMMSTFIGEVEWSATGLAKASLATGGAGETDVRFAIGRALSRLHEMNSNTYGVEDD